MSGKIDRAWVALGASLGGALFASGFLAEGESLAIDPSEAVEPDPEPEEDEGNLTTAALLKVETKTVRTILGGPKPRYVVERSGQLELAIASPDDDWRAETLQRTLGAVALVPVDDPTLGGAAERVEILGAESDDLPRTGEKCIVTFALRVRSGDPLGLSD